MWQIEEVCDRFCIIAGGAVQTSGTLAELRSSLAVTADRSRTRSAPVLRACSKTCPVRASRSRAGNGEPAALVYDYRPAPTFG